MILWAVPYVIPHIPAFLHLQIGRGAGYDLRSLYGEHQKTSALWRGAKLFGVATTNAVTCKIPLTAWSRSTHGAGTV